MRRTNLELISYNTQVVFKKIVTEDCFFGSNPVVGQKTLPFSLEHCVRKKWMGNKCQQNNHPMFALVISILSALFELPYHREQASNEQLSPSCLRTKFRLSENLFREESRFPCRFCFISLLTPPRHPVFREIFILQWKTWESRVGRNKLSLGWGRVIWLPYKALCATTS